MELMLHLATIIVLIVVGCYGMTLAQRSYEDKLYEKFVKRLEEEGRI